MAAVSQRVQSSAASNSGQSSSAPVLEFVCLFSRDLRKKQKRWQDGRIKYHAFNKRVMVYDERGNFIGDTHWREAHDFEEGEELELERGGVIVQTAECIGSRMQDLSELIDKRAQEKAQRQSAAAARHSSPLAPASVPRPPHAPPGHLQLHSRPLHNVVGTPTGHYGRAVVPSESPYEQRQRQNAEQADPHDEESPRPAKRRKRDIEPPSKTGYAQNLFGATLSLSATPMSSAPVRHQPRKALQTSGSYSFPRPSSPGDQDCEVGGRQTRPSDTDIPRPKSRPLTESTASPNVPRPAVKIPKPTHAAQRARETAPLVRGNTREDPIALDPVSSQEESCNASKQARNTTDNDAKPRPMSTFSLQSKAKPKGSRREAPNDKALGNRFAASLRATSKTNEFVQVAGKPTAEDYTAGRRRPAVDESSTSLDTSKEPLAASTESLQNISQTIGNSEARIELRVKSRKKRGLLMMSEKSVAKKPRNSNNPSFGLDNEAEAPLLEAPSSNMGTQKATDPEKPGKEASNDRLFNAESFEDASADERCFSSDDPLEVMSIVGQVKGQIPGARQVLGKGGRGAKARLAVDQDSDGSHVDDVPRGKRIASPEPEDPPVSMKKRSSTRATADKAEKAPPPRLVRLSRKGIRSKEVIGLTFDDDDDKPAGFSTASIQGFNTEAQHKSKAVEDTPSDTPGCQEQNDRSTSPNGASGQQPAHLSHEADAVSLIDIKPSRELPADGPGRRGLRGALPRPQEEPPNTCDIPPIAKVDNIPRIVGKSETVRNAKTAVAEDVSTPKEPTRGRGKQPRSHPDARKDEPHTGRQQHTAVPQEAPLTAIEAAASHLLPRAQPMPRLANPATRGKKAAKASDAAGKMPEVILPAEPPSLFGRQQPSRMSASNSGNGGEPKPELPGFSKATGGPWSREAHDLFEFTRPSEKTS